MVDVFEQVEEELRADRYKRLARQWGPWAAGLLLLALIGALAYWGWDSMKTRKADEASVIYERGVQSLMADNPVGAAAAFAEAEKKADGAYKALSLIQLGGLAFMDNRFDEAIDYYDRASRASRDPLIADVALLKAVYVVMDTGTLEQVLARVEPLARDGRPMRAFALEAQWLSLIQHGKIKEAEDVLTSLQYDVAAPQSVRDRAQIGLSQIRNGTAQNIGAVVREMARIEAETAAAGAQAGDPAQNPAQNSAQNPAQNSPQNAPQTPARDSSSSPAP